MPTPTPPTVEIDVLVGATLNAYSSIAIPVPETLLAVGGAKLKAFVLAEVRRRLRSVTFDAAWDDMDDYRIVDTTDGVIPPCDL